VDAAGLDRPVIEKAVGARSTPPEGDVAGTHNDLRSHGCFRCLVIRLRRTLWSGFRQIPTGGEFEMPACRADYFGFFAAQAGRSGCPDAAGLLNKATRKTENGRIRKGHFRRARATPRVAPGPWTAGFETDLPAGRQGIRVNVRAGVNRRGHARNDETPRGSPHGVLR
jgi:hypothetical protein